MPNLPTLGQANWGTILNSYLNTTLSDTGGINTCDVTYLEYGDVNTSNRIIKSIIDNYSTKPVDYILNIKTNSLFKLNKTADSATLTLIGDIPNTFSVVNIYTNSIFKWVQSVTKWQVISSGEIINVKDYGARGDGDTDDTAALQNIVNMGGRIYFPAATFVISDTLVLPFKEIAIFGEGTDNDLNGSQSIIKSMSPNKDYIRVNSSGFNIRNITFSPYGGALGKVLSATSNSFTMEEIRNVQLANVLAENLSIGKSVYRHRIYTYNNNLYKAKDATGGLAGDGSGVITTLPNHIFGTVVIDGITWEHYGNGNTYQLGQYSNGAEWLFHGISGNTLLDVTPSEYYANYTPLTIPEPEKIIGRYGYYAYQGQRDGQPSNGTACINLQYANDPYISGCWFIHIANGCIHSQNAQGGCWTNNEVDGSKVGISGNLLYSIIKNNRMYGCGKAFSIENGQKLLQANISDNHFHLCNVAFYLSDKNYNPTIGEPEESNIVHSLIADNKAYQCGKFMFLEGARSLLISSNHVSRSNYNVIEISKSKKIAINNNFFTGAGENSENIISSYTSITNNSLYIVLKLNQFDKLNPGEHIDYLIKKDDTIDAAKIIVESNEIFDYNPIYLKNF